MEIERTYSLLESLFEYAFQNSITKRGKRSNASVVCLEKLGTHLQLTTPEEYAYMKKYYDSLLDFLDSKEQKIKCTKWIYEIMTTNMYNCDPRHSRNEFLSLKSYQPFNALLFILYQKDFTDITTCGDLSEDILIFYRTRCRQAIDTYNAKVSIKNRVNEMIQKKFPQFNMSVEIIRLSNKNFLSVSQMLTLGIVIHRIRTNDSKDYADYEALFEPLYDFDFMSECLENIGMVCPTHCPKKPNDILFRDKTSGIRCRSGIDTGMRFSRERLIEAYLKLDDRIDPLITVIFFITKRRTSHFNIISRQIFKQLRSGHFDFELLDQRTVLPGYSVPSRFTGQWPVTAIHREEIRQVRDRYHTCVVIQNDVSSNPASNKTVWISKNKDSLKTLLLGYFNYYAKIENISDISIVRVDISIIDAEKNEIQDPLSPSKSISIGCDQIDWKNLRKVFKDVANLLEGGKSLEHLLIESIQYASNNSIAKSNKSPYPTYVVDLKDLDSHLQHTLPSECDLMNTHFVTLLEFLMSADARKHMSDRWVYEIMTTNQYSCRRSNNHHLALKSYQPYNNNLFIVNSKKPKASVLQSLSDNIMARYQENYVDKREIYDMRKRIRDRVNEIIQEAFPSLDISVQLISCCYIYLRACRLSHVDVVFADSLLDLAIIPARFYKPDKEEFDNHKQPYKALNDFEYIGECLKKMGMTDVVSQTLHKFAKNLTFVHPEYGQKCTLGVEKYMIFEREELFEVYLQLDPRMRPLVTSIYYFIRSHQLHPLDRQHFLSGYSYMIMILYYLLNGLRTPLIPNIQSLPNNECKVADCFYNAYKGPASAEFKKRIREVEVRYHTCVYIRHGNDETEMEGKTIWNSHNKTDLGTLLIGFLNYYSIEKNFCACISISPIGKRGRVKDHYFTVTIRDPFLQIHNMACGCNETTMKELTQIFGNAANLLIQGKTLDEICQNPIAGCSCPNCI
ncbi:uncharacterized protein EV154DRAFT_483477 [Mucor mucedo]|uniref:uncharacterized protein n=1 Tax=Mucor mucedo TaxID=29922 RepID=UPI00221E64AB|nr:uncharacterized protein EV154DRAFT_483477 [Mucor mucedo]KAI7889062.1 hypothetical protein EV154DRAFT_483477 [Mucor mucedo]